MPDEQKSGSDSQAPAEQADTQEEQKPSTPAAGSGHVQEENTSESTPKDKGHVDEKEEQKEKREEGTINKLRREKEAQETRLQNLSNWIRTNPTRYRNALVDTANMTEEQANAEVQKFHPSWQPKAKRQEVQQPAQQPTAPVFDSDTQAALSEITQRHREKETKIQKAVTDFIGDNPGLDEFDTRAIGMEAMRLVEKQGLEPSDALKEAHVKILKPEEYKKQGVAEGMSRALSGAPASGSGAGASQPVPSGPSISSVDQEVMDRLGISENKKAREVFEGFLDE
jgi:hypothetical protein